MTQDEIYEIAEQAGIAKAIVDIEIMGRFANLVAQHEHKRFYDAAMKATEKAVDVAIVLEREACAKIVDVYIGFDNELSNNIRARGQA